MKKELNFLEKKAFVKVKDENDHIQKKWAMGNYYEVHRNGLLNYIFATEKKGGKFVDIGASIGNHTIFFHAVMEARSVHSFEPYSKSFKHLTENVKLNKFETRLHNVALGDHFGKCSMTSASETNVGMMQVVEGNDVDLVTLDSVEGIDDFDVMKIDVEHYNEQLLRGAKRTLTKAQGNVYIEAETDEVLKLTDSIMREYGYEREKGICLNHTPTYKYIKCA